MSKIIRPVSSIKHDDKRAAIPDSTHQGEEQMAISGQPEQSEYSIFRHEYTGGLFKVRSIHFCGGERKEFAAWRKGLDTVAKDLAKKKAERTLRLQFNDEVWDTLYGFKSEPIPYEKGKRIAVRVVSQFGEESTKILTME